MDAAVTGVIVGTSQNELAVGFIILSANGNLEDGDALFSAGAGNLLTGGSADQATLQSAFDALRQSKIHGRASNASPRYLVVPSDDELDARAVVATLSATADPVEVVSVATDYLTTGGWYVFADPQVFPVLARTTLRDSDGQSLRWARGVPPASASVRSLALEGIHSIGFQAVSRCGAVRIEMT